MMYKSSKGPVEISTMPLRYATNALAKLRRDEPERKEEIDALAEHVANLEAGEEPENPRVVIGGNNPPEEMPAEPKWAAVKVHMDDLLTEAANWADGVKIETQGQADEVGKLRQLLQDAASLADKARVAEKEPLDKAVAEIQDRYNTYIAPMKNKKPGSVSKAIVALGNVIQPWLTKLDDEKRAREAKAREEAEEAQAVALAARQEAKQTDDLSQMDAADDLLEQAEEAAKALRTIEKEKVQVAGAFRATGLRSKWVAKLLPGGGGKALVHYANARPDQVKAFLQSLADDDVRHNVREIPGFDILEERLVA